MYSYDRTKTAATAHMNFIALELNRPINTALEEFGTVLEGQYGLSTTGDTTFSISGKTRDGRTFRGTGRIYLKGHEIQVEVDLDVKGTVEVGPMPEILDKVGKLIEEIVARPENANIRKGQYFGGLLGSIAAWHAGKPVDKKNLRSSLRFAIQRLEDMQPGGVAPKDPLIEKARLAAGAAMRLLKD